MDLSRLGRKAGGSKWLMEVVGVVEVVVMR